MKPGGRQAEARMWDCQPIGRPPLFAHPHVVPMNADHPRKRAARKTETEADPVEVRQSPVHGQGAFATRGLPRGHRIGVYGGRRYAAGEVVEHDWNNTLTYVFGLSDGSYIDGAEGGNATRHLNHSCAPNCAAVEVTHEDGRLDIVIEAARRIRAGEELFLDYCLDIGDDDPADYPCHCGSKKCRGTIAAPAAADMATPATKAA
jgi:hypothetical protein